MNEPPPGDADPRWRASYRSVRKDLLRDDATTNRRRLERMGIGALGATTRVLDLGAGDGNVRRALAGLGLTRVVAVEPQRELATEAAAGGATVQGGAQALPFRDAAFDVVLAMDVLHHVEPRDLDAALVEVARVLQPDGRFLVCEPANTRVRRAMARLLFSPLASLTAFTRHKRTMVELEWPTLRPWLDGEPEFALRLGRAGFTIELAERRWLHADLVGRRCAATTR